MARTKAGLAVLKEVVGAVDTLQDLRDSGGELSVYEVSGNSVAGDGGGGTFIYFSGQPAGTYVDDNGITILPTGGDGGSAWVRNHSGAINVKWFGATGDGTTNDTISIQSALDKGAKEVYIPKGVYRAIGLTVPAALTLRGEGQSISKITPYSSGTVIHVNGNGDYVRFENFGILHDRSFPCDGIIFDAIANNRWCHMDNVLIESLDGYAINVTNIILETVLSRVKVRYCGNASKPAIFFENPTSAGDYTNNITIRDLAMFAPQGVGIRIESDKTADVGGSTGTRMVRIKDSLIHGGNISGAVQDPYFANLVEIVNFTSATVENNRFSQIATGFFGLLLDSVAGQRAVAPRVTGNNFASLEGDWNGIYLNNTADAIVGANHYQSGASQHITIGSLASRTFVDYQSTHVGTDLKCSNSGGTTWGYHVNGKISLQNKSNVTLTGVRGLNGSVNLAGSVAFSGETSKTVTFTNTEPDTNYFTLCTPNGNINVWISSKSTTGFTINTSAAFTGIISWAILRP